MKNFKKLLLPTIAGLLLPAVIYAASGGVPYVFTAGTPIKASEVNANFSALDGRISGSSVSSGTRLTLFSFHGADGSSAPMMMANAFGRNDNISPAFWDTQLGVACSLQYAGDGSGRCLPTTFGEDQIVYIDDGTSGVTRAFSDASCTLTLLGRPKLSGEVPLGGFTVTGHYFIDGQFDAASGHQMEHVLAEGAAFSGQAYGLVYDQGTGTQICTPVSGAYRLDPDAADALDTVYSLGAEVPASQFVAFTSGG